MIYNKKWKKEILHLYIIIYLLYKLARFCDTQWVQHKLSKWIVFSAVIIKKICEAEKRYIQAANKNNWTIDEQEIMVRNTRVTIMGREKTKINNENECEEYGLLVDLQEEISTICNKIIHDNDWHFWYDKNDHHKLNGFLTSSDSEDKQYVVPIPVWLQCLLVGRDFYNRIT